MKVEPYLSFEGRCEEALEFYRTAVGAEVQALMRFRDNPPEMIPPGSEDKVMHACFKIGESIVMASDGNCGGTSGFQGISLTLSVESDEEAERKFAALSEGGQVQVPIGPTFFASRFGMVADRFGVPWMVIKIKET